MALHFQIFCVYVFVLYQSLPDEDEKNMTCISRGTDAKTTWSLEYQTTKKIYFICIIFLYFPAPIHPIPSPWKCQHPFHGRLTSNMSCKRCEQQVSLFVFLPE